MSEDEIPESIHMLFRMRRWGVLSIIFTRAHQESASAIAYNKTAVERVKSTFTELTGYKPYTSHEEKWDAILARLVDHAGPDALIADIESARRYQPRSLLFFIYRADGKASRWQMLVDQLYKDKHEKDKQELLFAWQDIKDIVSVQSLHTEPTWVVSAKKRLELLQNMRLKVSANERAKYDRETATIQARLSANGYKPA
jgi:hypothetical protein